MANTTLLNVTEAAESRKSIREYTDEKIPQAKIEEILRVAGLAPSPWNLQPWRVIAVQDPETKEALKGAAYGQKQVGNAQVVFVIASDMQDVLANIEETVHPGYGDKIAETAAGIKATFDKMDTDAQEAWGNAVSYIFVGYLTLAAEQHGYSTSAMLGFDPAKVKELFGLAETARIPALVAMGVKNEEGFPHHRHTLDRFVTWK